MWPQRSAGGRAVLLALLIVGLVGLAILWKIYGPANDANFSDLLSKVQVAGNGLPPWAAIGYLLVASVIAVPMGLIIIVAYVVFGPWMGALYTLAGATLGATVSYAIGRYLGHEWLRLFAGERINRISTRLAERGILTVIVIRMLPIAPFAIVNMVAGTSHLRSRDFILGTILGMFPGTVLIAFSFSHVQGWL